MKSSETTGKLAAALCAFQATLEGAKKDSQNPFFKSTYADLNSVWDAVREGLASNGLAVVQGGSQDGHTPPGHICISTRIMHVSGEWVEDSLELAVSKQDPQACGAAITYARRYGLAAMLGVVQEDDDAESVVRPKPKASATHVVEDLSFPESAIPADPLTERLAEKRPDVLPKESMTAKLVEVRETTTQTGKKKWGLALDNGSIVGTFSGSLAEAAKRNTGEECQVWYKQDGKYLTLVWLEVK